MPCEFVVRTVTLRSLGGKVEQQQQRGEAGKRATLIFRNVSTMLQAPLSAHYITGGPNGGVATVKRTSAVGTLATHV